MSEESAGPEFRVSSYSGGTNCVEVARLGERMVVRRSRHPEATFSVGDSAWAEFVAAVRHGRHDPA